MLILKAMEKYNCIIVEDEPLAAEVLRDYIAQVPFLNLIQTCCDAMFAMEVLKDQKTDVIFLDIHLPKLKGLDFIKTVKNPPQIIITSAYGEYALKGYEFNVIDYLLKPIDFDRFLMAVNKLRPQNEHSFMPEKENISLISVDVSDRPHLFLNVGKKKIKVYLDEILFIESLKEYIKIVAKDKSILTKFQLSQIEQTLAKENFIRVHRSFIVAKNKIDAFTAIEIEVAGNQIPIGRSYKELVLKLLGGEILN
jgi:DNA-binding LytR/AlgR family response regulator